MEHNDGHSDQFTCLDPYFASFEESLATKNYKPWTLKNYRCLLRRFGRLMETEGIVPSALTPDLAAELARRLPATPTSMVKIPNLARRFVEHLIELGLLGSALIMPNCRMVETKRATRQTRPCGIIWVTA